LFILTRLSPFLAVPIQGSYFGSMAILHRGLVPPRLVRVVCCPPVIHDSQKSVFTSLSRNPSPACTVNRYPVFRLSTRCLIWLSNHQTPPVARPAQPEHRHRLASRPGINPGASAPDKMPGQGLCRGLGWPDSVISSSSSWCGLIVGTIFVVPSVGVGCLLCFVAIAVLLVRFYV